MANSTDLLLDMLANAYPRGEMTAERRALYAQMLADIPGDELRAAVIAYITSSDSGQWLPSVSQLRALVGVHRRRASGLPSAEEAWLEVLKAWDGERGQLTGQQDAQGRHLVERVRYQWSHPLTEKVARDLGWPRSFPGENHDVSRSNWLRVYEQAARRATAEAVEHPAVTKFINHQAGQMRIGAGQQIKQLAEKLGDSKR